MLQLIFHIGVMWEQELFFMQDALDLVWVQVIVAMAPVGVKVAVLQDKTA